MRYASGKSAWGTCQRCGMRARYTELVADGQYPNLRVHLRCRDTKNPQERPARTDDAVLLRHPAPDLDDDSAGASTDSLAAAMQWDSGFGLADGYVLDGYVTASYVGST